MAPSEKQLIEKIEVLDGSRPGARDRAAVRIVDLVELLQLPDIRVQEISAAPTASEYNALVRDFKELHKRLTGVARILQNRLLR